MRCFDEKIKKIVLFCLLTILWGGCGQPRCGQGEASSSAPKKILRVNCSRPPITLDTRKMCEYISSTLGFMLFEGMTRMTEESSHSMALAEQIFINEEGTVYTFQLRDALWSDGTKITAEDFARSWRTILEPKFPAPSCQLLYPILGAEQAKKGEIPVSEVGIKVLASNLLEITLARPTPFFLDITSFAVLFPLPQPLENKTDEIARKNPTAFISSGPFRLKKYLPHKEIILEKNPFYWESSAVCLDEIHISLIGENATAFQMYEKGSLDLLGLAFSQVPRDAILSLQKRGELLFKPVGATSLCQFNMDLPPFSNKNFRKAIALAINRAEIVQHLTLLGESTATCIVPPLLKGGKEDSFFVDGDVEEARTYLQKALAELGCSLEEIGPIPYLYTLSDLNGRMAEVLSRQLLENLGIVLKPQGCEFKTFIDLLHRRQFLMSQSAWIVQYNDLMSILDRFKEKSQATNDPGWENAAYKELLETSYFCKTKEERMQLLHDAEALFMDEMPQTPLFHWNYSYLMKPYVRNLYISPIGSIHLTHTDIVMEDEKL